MKTVFLFRHAKSSWKNAALADHDRPLNKRGKRDAPRMGRLLTEQGVAPDLILCSTAKRARETAQAAVEDGGLPGEVEFSPDLYHGDPAAYCSVLRDTPENCETVVIVAHNPNLEILLTQWTGLHERLPTAALAKVSLDVERWSEVDLEVRASLVALWRPRELE